MVLQIFSSTVIFNLKLTCRLLISWNHFPPHTQSCTLSWSVKVDERHHVLYLLIGETMRDVILWLCVGLLILKSHSIIQLFPGCVTLYKKKIVA